MKGLGDDSEVETAADHFTVNLKDAECCKDPEVPVTVIAYVPTGVPLFADFCCALEPQFASTVPQVRRAATGNKAATIRYP